MHGGRRDLSGRPGCLLLAWVLLASGAAAGSTEAGPFDVVLAGGRAMDPESGLDAIRWVGLREGRIAAVSAVPLEGATSVDVRGHVVAPGFIDLHVHGQEPRSYDLLAQDGVTTALELEAGVHDLDGFLARREGRARVHHGASAGHIPARAFVFDGVALEHFLTARAMEGGPRLWWLGPRMALGFEPTYADAVAGSGERMRILEALREELDAGAIGLGLGLAYTPGADDAEVASVLDLAAERGVPAFVHLPGQADRADVAPLEQALGKMSLEPARRLEGFVPAMAGRGRLRVGADADLVVFDPEQVQDRATFEAPLQGSAGIAHVVVSGAFVVRDGALVEGAFPGRGLRARTP